MRRLRDQLDSDDRAVAELARMVREVEDLEPPRGAEDRVRDAIARGEVERSQEWPTIHKYRVTGVIGRGGMGTVYAAEHEILHRPAAIKVLVPELSQDQEVVTRLFNEARAAKAIRHPGIIEIYDVGWTAEGGGYIVMELLEGESLAVRLARGPLPWRAALAIARQIAGALSAAHAAGVVHRDLKPDNVFLTLDPEVPGGERIKLLDFGVAKASSGETVTRTGAIIGTPAYMAPEQCRGVAIDHRADLYALGCVLFALCTGRPPFAGEGSGDLLAAHIQASAPTLADLGVEVPRPVELLLRRLLAKSPAERTQTAAEMIDAIDDIVNDEPPAGTRAPGAMPALASLAVARRPSAANGRRQPTCAAPLITTLSGAAGVSRPPTASRSRRWRSVAIAVAVAAMLVVAVATAVRPQRGWFTPTSDAPTSAIQPLRGAPGVGSAAPPDAAVSAAAAGDARASQPETPPAPPPAPGSVSPAPAPPPDGAAAMARPAPPDVDPQGPTRWVAVDARIATAAGVARGHSLVTSSAGGKCRPGFVCLYQNDKFRGMAYGVSDGGTINDLDKVNCATCKNGTRGNDGTFHGQMSSWDNATDQPYCWYYEVGFRGKSIRMSPHTKHGQVLPSNNDRAMSLGPC